MMFFPLKGIVWFIVKSFVMKEIEKAIKDNQDSTLDFLTKLDTEVISLRSCWEKVEKELASCRTMIEKLKER